MRLRINRLRGRSMELFVPLIVFALVAVGLSAIYSASYYTASRSSLYGYNGMYFVKGQLRSFLIGLVGMMLFAYFDYHWLYRGIWAAGLFVAAIGLLVLVTVYGKTINGAKRWIKVGSMSVQPVEIVKVLIVFVLAYLLAHFRRWNKTLLQFILCLVVIGIPAFITYMQPNLSSAIMLVLVGCFVMAVGGVNFGLYCTVIPSVAGAAFLYLKQQGGYQWERIVNIAHPFSDPLDTTYQISQSLMAVGGGGIFGRGIGESMQKYGFLPYAETDFIFSIIAEETGLVGCLMLIAFYFIFVIHGFRIAAKAKDMYGKLIASGLTAMIGMQAFVHMLVCLGIFPTTGMPLPFISYGGSSLILSMCAAGILMNISRQSGLSDYLGEEVK